MSGDHSAPARGLVFGVMFGLVAWLVIIGVVLAVLAHAGTSGPLRYREVDGNGPRLVIRGDGCFSEEVVTTLRLVEWVGSDRRVVYRCVTP